MQTKKFLIQITYDEQTRWPFSDAEITARLQGMCQNVLNLSTDGRIPQVIVTAEASKTLQDFAYRG